MIYRSHKWTKQWKACPYYLAHCMTIDHWPKWIVFIIIHSSCSFVSICRSQKTVAESSGWLSGQHVVAVFLIIVFIVLPMGHKSDSVFFNLTYTSSCGVLFSRGGLFVWNVYVGVIGQATNSKLYWSDHFWMICYLSYETKTKALKQLPIISKR